MVCATHAMPPTALLPTPGSHAQAAAWIVRPCCACGQRHVQICCVRPGVPGEDLNLNTEMAFYMGVAFADMLSKQLGKPASELRVSVRCCSVQDAGRRVKALERVLMSRLDPAVVA